MSERSPAAGELRTARLSLRRPAEADIDSIFAIHHYPGTCLHNPSDALSRPDEAEALYRDGGAGSGAFLEAVPEQEQGARGAGLAVGTVGGHVDGDHRLERRDLAGKERFRQVGPDGLLTQLNTVKTDVKSGTVPTTTINALNAASTTADHAC